MGNRIKGKNTDFSKGNVAGLILKQALPLMLSSLVQLLYNIVDRMYIGRIPGEGSVALTGLGLTFPVVSVVLAFTMLFGQGGAPVFSIAMGAGQNEKASKVLGNSFSLLLIGGGVLTVVLYVFMRPILFYIGADEATYSYAASYLQIYLIGTVMTMTATGLNFYISSQGYAVRAMINTLSGAVLNIILDPIFIFALKMNIRGAALATVIAQSVSMLMVVRFLVGKRPGYRIVPKHMVLEGHICFEICSVGFTGFIMQFTNSAVLTVCNKTLSEYGGTIYIGVMTIVSSVRDIMTVAVNSIANGAQPVIGFNYGAGRYDRVRNCIRTSFLLLFMYTSAAWLLIELFPRFFIGLLITDSSMIDMSVPALHIYFLAYVFMAFQFSGQSTFMSLEKNGRAIFFSLFRKVILVIPLTIYLPIFIDPSVNGVFMAEPVSNIVGGLASFITMYFTIYRRLDKPSDSYD